MPRYARNIEPGGLVHVIARIANGEHRIAGDTERAEYLRRAGLAFRRSDWRALSYGLMSNHLHWELIAGFSSFSRWSSPLHGGFARWLNRRQGRFGVVFAERPKTIVLPLTDAARLTAYLHNNPVRAGVARTASTSTWTSHRA